MLSSTHRRDVDGALRVVQQLQPSRPQQGPGDHTVSAAAHHHELGMLGRLNEGAGHTLVGEQHLDANLGVLRPPRSQLLLQPGTFVRVLVHRLYIDRRHGAQPQRENRQESPHHRQRAAPPGRLLEGRLKHQIRHGGIVHAHGDRSLDGVATAPDHHHRTGGVGGHPLADRAQQQAGEPAVPPAAQHDQLGAVGLGQ
jgi:hypothetical protein